MCEALRELMADEIEEGIAKGITKGRAEGIAKGRAEGIAEGRAEGRAEGKFKMLLDLIHDGTLTMAVAATKAGLSEEAFIGKLKEYKLLPNNS